MQEAIPYKTWLPIPKQPFLSRSQQPIAIITDPKPINDGRPATESPARGDMKSMVSENALIVFGRRGCCMTHVVKRLLQGLGVNPVVYEVHEDEEDSVVDQLEPITGAGDGHDGRLQFPAVFIGGRLFGGLDRIMATHITGELIPVLKKAGALWL